MAADLPAELREAAGRAAHMRLRQDTERKHATRACRGRLGYCCDPLVVTDWPDLTDDQREAFRAQGDPALFVFAPVLARAEAERVRYAAALDAIIARGCHAAACYDDIWPCVPECPTGMAKRAREDR